jgi:hypothetical protein
LVDTEILVKDKEAAIQKLHAESEKKVCELSKELNRLIGDDLKKGYQYRKSLGDQEQIIEN